MGDDDACTEERKMVDANKIVIISGPNHIFGYSNTKMVIVTSI